jgi:hypothetical protein
MDAFVQLPQCPTSAYISKYKTIFLYAEPPEESSRLASGKDEPAWPSSFWSIFRL